MTVQSKTQPYATDGVQLPVFIFSIYLAKTDRVWLEVVQD